MPMGHNPNTITAANSVILFRCVGVYDNWIQLTGAQSDAFLSLADVTFAQSRMGVDGNQAFGYIPHETPVTVSLEANSPSIMVMEHVYNDHVERSDSRLCEIQVLYPSVKRKHSFSGPMITKSGGTGISQLLTGHTYQFNFVSKGIEEIN